MAGESFLYLDEVLANLPDNTQGLIQPVNSRDVAFNVTTTFGAVNDPTSFTVASGTNVSINQAGSMTYLGGQGWSMDGNGLLYPDFITTPPTGFSVVTLLQAQFTFESSNNTSTTFAFTVGGTPVAWSTIGIEWSNQTEPMPVTMVVPAGADLSGGATETVGVVQTKGSGSGTVANFSMSVFGFLLATDPGGALNVFNGTNRPPV